MKLRSFATVVLLGLTSVAASAQVGVYLNPIAIRAANSVADSGPYAFLGQNSKSAVLYGINIGGYYDFYHSGKLTAGADLRTADLHTNNAVLRNLLVGARFSAAPFARPFKPYIQASVGLGSTKAPDSTIRKSKIEYGVFAGLDYTLTRHIDFRAVEIGYGSLITVSSATVGGGGDIAIPSSSLINFSTGFVFRFP